MTSGDADRSDDRLLKVSEAATRLNVSEKTIRKYIEAGILASERLPFGQFRIRESAVRRLLMKHTVTGS